MEARGRRGGTLELGLEKLAGQFTGSEYQLSGSTLRPSRSSQCPQHLAAAHLEVCGLTGLFHHGILDKSFPALDLELLMLMVGLKVT